MAGRNRTILLLICGLVATGMLWWIGSVAQRRGEPAPPVDTDGRNGLQPYTDAEVQAIIDAVRRDAGDRIDQNAIPTLDKHLRQIDPARLNLDQYDRLHD